MKNLLLVILFSFIHISLYAQRDTLWLNNNDVIIGEVKSIKQGVVIMETSYSDSDFKIEFKEVKGLSIEKRSIIELTGGRFLFGNVTTDSLGFLLIAVDDSIKQQFQVNELVGLKEVNENIWKRFRGSIDLGFNLQKANNNTQFTSSSALSFTSRRWFAEGSVNAVRTDQDNAERSSRTDANFELVRLLRRNWFLLADVSFLSNTQQALAGRTTPSLGLGKRFISTSRLFLGLSGGLTYNIENYSDTTQNKTSAESFVSLSYNMFDFSDISLVTGIKVYPSLSEARRVRIDYDFNLKYDLPWDFYFKTGFTLNYDNQPAISGKDVDYFLSTGFGWKFN